MLYLMAYPDAKGTKKSQLQGQNRLTRRRGRRQWPAPTAFFFPPDEEPGRF